MTTILVQQTKKDYQFKLFELKNCENGLSSTPIGFSGLGTDYPELKKFMHMKDRTLVFQDKNLSSGGAPIALVNALQKIHKGSKILFSNNYSAGQLEDISSLAKDYSSSR